VETRQPFAPGDAAAGGIGQRRWLRNALAVMREDTGENVARDLRTAGHDRDRQSARFAVGAAPAEPPAIERAAMQRRQRVPSVEMAEMRRQSFDRSARPGEEIR